MSVLWQSGQKLIIDLNFFSEDWVDQSQLLKSCCESVAVDLSISALSTFAFVDFVQNIELLCVSRERKDHSSSLFQRLVVSDASFVIES
jgi:hypothetical protein